MELIKKAWFRFGTGLGLVAPILGDEHWLNQKNAAYGFGMYTFLLIIGTHNVPLNRTQTLIFRHIQ